LNGTRGFVGSALLAQLDDAERASSDNVDRSTDLFVNLANIATDAHENLALLDRNVTSYGGSARHWVQIQSFVTLHGDGRLDPDACNAGFRPRLSDQYVMGKLAQEQYLLDALQTGRIQGLTLIYLPAMLDEGGAWNATIKRAQAYGYLLPDMADDARCNFAYIDDLATTLTRVDPSASCRRILLNRPEAATTRWSDVMGAKRLSPRDLGMQHALKSCLRAVYAQVKARRVASRGVPVAADIADLTVPEPTAVGAAVPAPPAPVEFFGVTRHLIAHQPFLMHQAG
jgi:hypothetical protein